MTEPTSTIDPRQHPKGPNFLLIVVLFGVAIILIFIAAYVFLLGGGRHLVPGKHDPHPTSQLILPGAKDMSIAARGTPGLRFVIQQQKNQAGV